MLPNALCKFFIRCHRGGCHRGLNWNRGGIERVFFIFRLPLRCPGSHVWNTNASAKKWEIFHFLRWCLHLHLRCGSSHVCLLVLVLPLAFAFPFASLVWTSLLAAICCIFSNSSHVFNGCMFSSPIARPFLALSVGGMFSHDFYSCTFHRLYLVSCAFHRSSRS